MYETCIDEIAFRHHCKMIFHSMCVGFFTKTGIPIGGTRKQLSIHCAQHNKLRPPIKRSYCYYKIAKNWKLTHEILIMKPFIDGFGGSGMSCIVLPETNISFQSINFYLQFVIQTFIFALWIDLSLEKSEKLLWKSFDRATSTPFDTHYVLYKFS